MTITCTKCGLVGKPGVDFYDAGTHYVKAWCRVCHRAAMKANREKRRAALGLPPSGTRGRVAGGFGRELTGVDVTPCAACGLRGHLANDPDRCLGSSELMVRTTRMGAWTWV